MFNPDEFLDAEVTEANDTTAFLPPVSTYDATIKSIKLRQWVSKSDPTLSGVAADIIWSIEDQELLAAAERAEVFVKQGLMLDMTPEGKLDLSKGKNVHLGRLRAALNMNIPGQPFSFNRMVGQAAKVLVKHRVDSSDIYAEVGSVAAI